VGGRSFRAFFDVTDEVHYVAASAGSEAVPYAACKMGPEGGGVVAAVERAWADQVVAVPLKTCAKVVGLKHLVHGDLFFEVF